MATEMSQDKSTGRFIVGGDFLDIGIPNQDGLTFSRPTIEWLMNNETFKDCLARRVYPVYIEHPADNTPGFRGTEAGFLIDCHIEGDKLKGKIELLDSTNEGRYIRDLYLHGVQPGVSIRADGCTDTGSVPGTTTGPIDFYGFDFVAQPAFKYAVPVKLAASRRNLAQGKLRLTDASRQLADRRKKSLSELLYNSHFKTLAKGD